MNIATVKITGVSPLGFGKGTRAEKLDKESGDEFEKRTWRDRVDVGPDGIAIISASGIQMCLQATAKLLSMSVPGKGKKTYTKHFLGGILVMDDAKLGVRREDVPGEWVHCNSDGIRGSGKRVWRCLPSLPAGWTTTFQVAVMDDTITKEVFEKHLREAGKFIGLNRRRPQNGGTFGRFQVDSVKWEVQ